ncbi:MAG: cell division topological specificity factor MinE [Anaerolineales bacterium]
MKLLGWLRGEGRNSARTAKERLQLVLVHDRADISPGKLAALKDDLIAVLSKHIEIDTHSVRVELTRERDQQRLVAHIPLAPRRARRREAG